MTILAFIFFLLIPLLGYFIYNNKRQNPSSKIGFTEFSIFTIGFIAFTLFCFGLMYHHAEYDTAIDIIDNGYTPFAGKHALSLFLIYSISIFSLLKLWWQKEAIPPIQFVLAVIFLIFGLILSVAIVIQVLSNTESGSVGFLFVPFPSLQFILTLIILFRIIKNEQIFATDKIYSNQILNQLNQYIVKSKNLPFIILIATVPVYIFIILILMLFGQDYNAITKVFTETTTWTFSQQTHPPFLDHRGHYLCTVAVCGNPKIVKPLRLGKRHGQEIIVNRQLLIANAFEELIEENIPNIHRFIRKIYDQYGYPLSKKITSERKSNLVYRFMKPLEYLFLFTLYLCCIRPELNINKQYPK